MLVNLLSNAVKFTPDNGAIGLEVNTDQEHHAITFVVWDTGIGIAQHDMNRLFQPFVQLDSRLSRQYDGTGLGLVLVYRMAEMHCGSISVNSTVGIGSRFTISLPWQSSAPTDLLLPPHVNRPAPIRTVLVVDDSPSATEQISRYLVELGMQVAAHSQGTGVIERALAVEADAIILDILLPDINGWDVLGQLRSDPRTRHIPVIIVSVVEERPRALALGAAGYLVKPLARQDVQQMLTHLSGTGQQGDAKHVRRRPAADTGMAPLVLLAEDNEGNITAISDYLRAKGFQVAVARNGNEAVSRAREILPQIILMDIQMPGMDGLEATKRIRADYLVQGIPIVALTALAMPGDRERCLEAGVNEYLSKPVSLKGLVEVLETHLSNSPHPLPPLPCAGEGVRG
jgi:CheY-like chemotaxis protein